MNKEKKLRLAENILGLALLVVVLIIVTLFVWGLIIDTVFTLVFTAVIVFVLIVAWAFYTTDQERFSNYE